MPREAFRPRLRAAFTEHGPRISRDERKGAAGRKPWDEVIIFKALVIQALYNLSDEQYQMRNGLSFMRFLGLGVEDRVPDATTLVAVSRGVGQKPVPSPVFCSATVSSPDCTPTVGRP
jgi:hypothetical protein